MKPKVVYLAVDTLFTCHAFAQNTVTIGGLIDGCVSNVSNEGGKGVVKLDGSMEVPSLLKIDEHEDLGGGVKVVFDSTRQFSLATGSFMPRQGLFGRNAFVGFDDQRWVKITPRNQYDSMADSLLFSLNDAAFYSLGVYGFRNGPFATLALPDYPTGAFDWGRMAGERVRNSVTYLSPAVSGFSAGAMSGFGGVAGSFGADNATNFG